LDCTFKAQFMSRPFFILLPIALMGIVILVMAVIMVIRYVRVGPNRVLIVSGRVHPLPDGTRRGFRIVKGGGTFVLPVIEKAEALSLEVLTIEMPKCRARAANGASLDADCVAQVKIKGDDASIVAAAEHFLSKNEAEMRNLVRPILEKHLRAIAGSLNMEEISRDLEACAARTQEAASGDLANMGLGLVGFTIRPGRY
jgi:flotillin